MPAALAILLYELLNFEPSVFQEVTESLVAGPGFWSVNRPYHFDCDLGGVQTGPSTNLLPQNFVMGSLPLM